MKTRQEIKIRNRKMVIALMEYIITLGCLLVAFVMISGKSIKQTNSYARPEEVSRYEIVEDKYLTRVRPLTKYETFKEIVERTLNREIKIYTDATKEEEVVEGIITSGMVVETENNGAIVVPTENTSYEVRVVGDLNKDGDCNVTELTKIIREIVGLERIGNRGEEISGDFNGDGEINVVDVTMCINYIVYGEIEPDKEEPNVPEIRIVEPEDRGREWYNGDIRIEIVENERKEGEIKKTETRVEKEGRRQLTTEEKEIRLTEEGRYVIESQSYGENGTKSEVVRREVNIDKTIPELEVSREDVDKTECKIVIEARDNEGIRKYSIVREGEEERSKEGIDEKEIKGYVTIRENGKYKVIVEDHAENKVEKEIEINNLNNRYTITFKNENGSIISQREYAEGTTVEVPQNPSKAEDNTNTYQFAGWKTINEEGQEIIVTSEEIINVAVEENKEYMATYTSTYKNYAVTFKDENGEVLTEKTDYHYGDSVAIPQNPSKAEDNTYTYEFTGWKNKFGEIVELTEETEVIGNQEYTAVYEAKKKGYIVRFKDEDGSILTEKTDYQYRERVAIPQDPRKAEDNTYTYEFSGWSPEVQETVTESKEYTATYTPQYKNYTVTFKDDNGTVITTKNDYHYGDTVVVPENPSKAEDNTNTYRFIGWDKEVSTEVVGNVEYTAVYEAIRKEHTITFKDENGEVLSSKTDYHYGEKVAIPQNPIKAEDNTYTYEFTGWTTTNEQGETITVTTEEIANGVVSENKEYTATYTPKYKNYTVTFKDENGTIMDTKNDYHYGDVVTIPENPSKAEDNTYTYEFVGWNEEVEETVTGNKEYTATYTSTYKNYAVTFKDENGEVLTEKIDYHYGDAVAVPQNPIKAEDETYTYEFAGWNEEVEETVTENKEYTATYRGVYKNYAVTFKDEDGAVITTKTDYHYNDTVTIPENPSKAEDNTYTYEFKGWTPDLGTTEEQPELKVTGNIEYTATYEAKYKEYTVTFKQDSGEILSNLGYHYGDKAQVPEDPHKLSTMEYAYRFTGWNKVEEGQQTPVTIEDIENTEVTKEIEYVATYEATKINYNLVFYNDDYNEETGEGTVIERRTYNYGDIINFPEATKEETEEKRYVFDSWKNLGTKEISATEIDIEFKAEYREEYYVARIEPIVQEEQIILEGKSYLTLKEAIEESGRVERTIRMLKDTEESVTIEDDQNITINLNGKTITAKKTYVIKNYGELKVVNNSDNEGKILEISEEDIGYGIYNRDGKVTIKSGTIAAETSKENGRTYAIYNQSESPLNITGGSVIAEAKGTNSIGAGIYNLAGKEIDITGGLVYGNAIGEGTTTYGIYNETDGKVNVTGGLIQAKASLASGISYGIYNKVSEEVIFNGGQITVQSDNSKAYGIYNEEGKVTLGEIVTKTVIDETTGEEQEITEEHKGTINVTASEGYGVYNDRGIVEEKIVTITTIGTTSYGIYNNEGTVNANKGEITLTSTNTYGIYNNTGTINIQNQTIELTSTNSYGIYNKNEASINGVTINNKNSGSNTYGIYNVANKEIEIQNITITGGNTGIYNANGNVLVNEANIKTYIGIDVSKNNQILTLDKVNIEANSMGIQNSVGKIVLKDVIINSNDFGIRTIGEGNTEIGTKNNYIDTGKPYVYGKSIAVCIEPNTSGNIKYYDGKLQGTSVIYGGISDIEINSEIKIETIDNNGITEEIATLQQIEERNIARIGETEYTSLAEAVNAVPENQTTPTTIEIIADSDISTVVEIPENKNIIIDLKGHTLTTYAKGGIINKGTLEIIDTQEENNEQQEPTQGNTTIKGLKESSIIKTLKLAENETGEGSAEGQATIGTIESKVGIGITNEGTLFLTGGKIVSNNDGIYNINNGQVTLQGAAIEANNYGISNAIGIINVQAGTVISQNIGIKSQTYCTVNVYGGTVEGKQCAISSGSELNITGGTIKSENRAINGITVINMQDGIIQGNYGICSSGVINVSGGKIKTTMYGIYTSNGTVNVTSGNIISDKIGIQSTGYLDQGANITIGNKEESITNKPTIIGKEYGIQAITDTAYSIKCYNGVVKGKIDAISGSIDDTRDAKELSVNTEIIDGEEYKVTSLVDEKEYSEPIAQIGEKTYTKVSSLKDDILEIPTNAENYTEVKILNDFTLLESIKVKSGQKVLLNLNGKTITSCSDIFNEGKLEITDTTEEHLGKITDTKITAIRSRGSNALTTITKGIIEGTKNVIVPFSNSTVVIGNKDGNVDDNQVLISSNSGNGIFAHSTTSVIKMYDGKIISLNSTIYEPSSIKDIEEGYKVVTNKVDGMNVTTLQLEDPVAKIGETEYYSLQTAIDECENGQTIELLRTIENQKQTLTIPEGKQINLDLKGKDINSNLDKTMINNGTLTIENSRGIIANTKADAVTIENNGVFNLNYGTISETGTQGKTVINNGTINLNSGNVYARLTLGTAVQNKGILNFQGGNIDADTYAIDNLEGGKINMTSGTVTSTNYGIYNESSEDIEVTGGTIQLNQKSSNNSLYGIYNNTDAKINITGGSIKSDNYNVSYDQYVYGIYNEANGEIVIGEQGKIELGTVKYNYGIYNKGNGNITTEGTISVNGEYLAYGIRNSGQGKVEVTGGCITSTSTEGNAYGIENGTFGELEVTRGNILANTISGTAYGINSTSTKTIKIKEGNITATGEESYGIYSNTADIEIGKNDEEIITTPIIEGNKEGLHVNATDIKFKFYDGKIIGKHSTNVEANISEDAKIIRHYNEETQIETLMVMGKDNYIITFYNEDKTQIIEQKLFKSTDTEINKPAIPEKEGFIGYWSDYEIGEHDIETQICYAFKRVNGTKLQATDENGLTWNYTYQDGDATDVYYESGDLEALDGIVNIPARLDGYPVVNLYNSSGRYRNIFAKQSQATNITVKQVKIPNSVTNIGGEAFYRCISLISVRIPNSVISIGYHTFEGCRHLTTIEIPNSVTSIAGGAFYDCTGLTELEIPNSVTRIGELVLYGCHIEKLSISGSYRVPADYPRVFTGVSIQEIELTGNGKIDYNYYVYVFSRRDSALNYTPWSGSKNSLRKITIQNGITEIGNGVFSGCKGLEEIEIPNSVISIGDNAFSGCKGLEEIEIPNSVISIGDNAFSGCSGLTKITVSSENIIYDSRDNCNGIIKTETNELIVGCKNTTIPSNVTSIGNFAFYGCSALRSIEIPNNVTSIGKNAFYECTGLIKLTMPGTLGIYNSAAFYNVTNLEEVTLIGQGDIPDYANNIHSTGSVTTISTPWYMSRNNIRKITIEEGITRIGSGAFLNCTGLTDIEIPRNITSIGNDAFRGCTSLTSIEIPNSVTNIEKWTFNGCSSLTNIEIPNSVTNIGERAFSGCKGLEEIEIPNSVISIGDNAFLGCSGLTKITVSSENIIYDSRDNCNGIIKTETNELIVGCKNTVIPKTVVSIGNYAFWECSSLTNIEIPNTVTSIGERAFSGCSGLTKLIISVNAPISYYNTFDGVTNLEEVVLTGEGRMKSYNTVSLQATAWYFSRKSLKNITIEEGITSIGSWAFYLCSSLEKIEISNSVTKIEESAFYSCSSLEKIVIPNSVTNIEKYAFSECSSLTNIEIPNSVTNIGNCAFSECSSLTNIEIPNSVINIGNCAFLGCSGLTKITVSSENIIYDSRDNCNGIIKTETNELIVGCKNTVIPETVMSIGNNSFSGCSDLTNMEIPKGVTNIGNGAFSECSGLEKIEIPNSVTNIGYNAFSRCSDLKSIIIDSENAIYDSRDNCNGIIKTETNELIVGCRNTVIPKTVKSIGSCAFSGCSGLEEIEIPNSVTSIEMSAFYGCSDLVNLKIPNSITRICDSAFEGCTGLTSIVIPSSVTTIQGIYVFSKWTNAQTIYIEVESKPDGWNSNWNYNCYANIVWGYKGE